MTFVRAQHPRIRAAHQAHAIVQERAGEPVDASDPRIDEVLSAPVEDVVVERFRYGSGIAREHGPSEQVAVVTNEEGVTWWVSEKNVDDADVPEHVRRAARPALDGED